MTASPVRLPAGVRDFLPRAAARRRAIAERLLGLFESWGYQRIITPVYECADVLERGLGQAGREEAIRFVEPGSGEVVALRPDFTPQVARMVATRLHDVVGPLRLCYEGAVHRLAGGLGQREILQAGVELIEADAPGGDAEALAVAAAVLSAMQADGVAEVRLDVGHVAPARAVLAAAPDDDVRARLTTALARKDRAGVARAAAALPAPWGDLAAALPRLWGPAAEVIAAARALRWPSEVRAGVDELAAVLEASRDVVEAGLHARITVDLGDVRGFDYYTGLRLAGYARGVGDAVLRGGRYDQLVGRYGRAARAIGFAVDIEAIAAAQRAADIAAPLGQAVLVVAPAADHASAARLAAGLRAAGLRAAVDLGSGADVLGYARALGFARVVRIDAGSVTVQSVGDGTTAPVSSADLAAVVAQLALEPNSRRS